MQSEFKQNPIQKQQYLWSVPQISLASYFAGPMAGCYFLGKNFQQLGSPDFAKRCYFAGIAGTILLVTILCLAPEKLMDHIPSFCIPIASLCVIETCAHYYQKQLIKENIDKGAKRLSYWWCVLLIVSFVVIQVPLVFLYTLLFASIF